MQHDKISTRLEQTIGKELWDLFEGDIVNNVMKQAEVGRNKSYYQQMLEGNSFKVTAELAPRLNDLFGEVRNALEFDQPVDFYITNSSELNASALSSTRESEPHIININSAIIDKYEEDELKFVIGHELGHIISNNIRLQEVINFIFPSGDKLPLVLYNKIILWQKLSELTADRYGLIACGNLEKCISSFFKLSSGLDFCRISLDFQSFLKENDKKIESYKKDSMVYTTTHPVNPIRIKAVELFYNSELYKNVVNKKDPGEDEKLFEDISGLTDLLLLIRASEMDHQRANFIASAGLVMASVDERLSQEEIHSITNTLASYFVFPEDLIRHMMEQKNTYDIFIQSAQSILNVNPGERQVMFEFLVGVALSDNEILSREIEFLYEVGKNMFGYSEIEVAQNIGSMIRAQFVPALYN